MTRQCISLRMPLALLLLLGLTDLRFGSADEHEDYFMQEMLTREQYNQGQVLEKPSSSTPDGQEHPRRSEKTLKGNKETDKNTAPAKSVKASNKKAVKSKKNTLKDSNSISEGIGQFGSIKEERGSFLHLHRSHYDGKKDTNSPRDDKYFGRE